MSHRRSSIPGTSTIYRREVACGIDPTRAIVQALAEFRAVRAGHIWSVDVQHDDGCPSLKAGGTMGACSCEIVQLEARRAA